MVIVDHPPANKDRSMWWVCVGNVHGRKKALYAVEGSLSKSRDHGPTTHKRNGILMNFPPPRSLSFQTGFLTPG